MASWQPPKVAHEARDRKEIAALFRSMERAEKKGDLEAAAALVDFPVLMATDDSKGQAIAYEWPKEKWMEVMRPFYAQPMPAHLSHKTQVSMLTDSLATVTDQATFALGGRKMTTRNAMLLVRKDGVWKVRSMVEGGWGDEMGAGGAGSGTGSGGQPR